MVIKALIKTIVIIYTNEVDSEVFIPSDASNRPANKIINDV